MCYNPITIVNPTKYVSLKYRDRYLLRVPCGKCAQCQENKKNEYYFRAFYHAEDTLSNGGAGSFVLFDTLTYSDKYLPHISDFFPTKYNYPCFNSKHIRLFVAKLRQRVKRKYGVNFDFMLSSEYGTSQFHQHRPHYHILFFVRGSVDPLVFSKEVSDAWYYGRTDGVPYKSNYYVLSNVLDRSDKKIRVLKYVTKYISKSCLFTEQIEKRVNAIMFDLASMYGDDYLETLHATKFREKLYRYIGQFHRQSVGFGSSYLSQLDLDSVFKTGQLFVRDNENVILSIPLPTYYKRKLFYKQVEVDGSLLWCPTDLGYEYLSAQENNLIHRLKINYRAALAQSNLSTDINSLVDYVVKYRGRIIADLPESRFEDRLASVDLFKYSTRYDRDALGKLGLTKMFLGNSSIGYNVYKMPEHITLFSFGKRFAFIDSDKERILDHVDYVLKQIDIGKQNAYARKQYLVNLYHYIGI